MNIIERAPGDRDRLARLIRSEREVLRRDRYRAVLLPLDGGEAAVIADKLGRSRRSVQDWVYAYRDGGIDRIHPPKRPGRKPKLPREREDELRARLDAGPTEADGVCTLRGRGVVRILDREFGVKYSLDGAYDLLKRLGYSCQSPRLRHEKRDPEAQEKFRAEARFGQQGTLTKMWAPKGSRPTAVKQTRYEWVYLYAAVEPATGASTALVAPYVNTPTMNTFLKMASEDLGPDDHAVMVMDQAGWHVSKSLVVPENITILLLPYSPELNPIENLWHWIKSHHTSNRAYDGYDELMDAVTDAWRSLTKKRLRSVCRAPYMTTRAE